MKRHILLATMLLAGMSAFAQTGYMKDIEVSGREVRRVGDEVRVTMRFDLSDVKMKRQHRVPLTPFMLDLIKRESEFSPHPRSKYVFAGRLSGDHISKQALAKWLHSSELKGKLVAHGLRSVARSWLADQGVMHDVAEECLAHKAIDPVYRAYQRSDFLDARRKILEQWCSYIKDCAESAELL